MTSCFYRQLDHLVFILLVCFAVVALLTYLAQNEHILGIIFKFFNCCDSLYFSDTSKWNAADILVQRCKLYWVYWFCFFSFSNRHYIGWLRSFTFQNEFLFLQLESLCEIRFRWIDPLKLFLSLLCHVHFLQISDSSIGDYVSSQLSVLSFVHSYLDVVWSVPLILF